MRRIALHLALIPLLLSVSTGAIGQSNSETSCPTRLINIQVGPFQANGSGPSKAAAVAQACRTSLQYAETACRRKAEEYCKSVPDEDCSAINSGKIDREVSHAALAACNQISNFLDGHQAVEADHCHGPTSDFEHSLEIQANSKIYTCDGTAKGPNNQLPCRFSCHKRPSLQQSN